MALLGIDEVGRGPLAGPLVMGAVILPETEEDWFFELKDSKKLTPKKRAALSEIILAEATTGLGWVSAPELDRLGIRNALRLATRRAIEAVQEKHQPFSEIIIDGNTNFLKNTPLEKYASTLIKADAKIRAVSAASIIAKVARDRYMTDLSPKYPAYHFDRHVGYGTKAHIKAIYKYGLTPEHRKSFEPCKTLSGFIKPEAVKPLKNTTKIGSLGESAVADYLISHGHQILARNHKTHFYEIDLISVKGNCIYFTEVKYRKTAARGSGLDAITKEKLHQMTFAAESYLKYTAARSKHLSPSLAVASVSGEDYTVDSWFPLES